MPYLVGVGSAIQDVVVKFHPHVCLDRAFDRAANCRNSNCARALLPREHPLLRMDVAHILHHVKWRLASLTPLQRACVALIIATQVLVLAIITYYGGDQILHSLARLAAWISHSKLGILILYISMTVCALPVSYTHL